MAVWFDAVLRVILPGRCPVCDALLPFDQRICPDCRDKLRFVEEPRCGKCGKQILDEQKEYCDDCQKQEHCYHVNYAALRYQDSVREMMYRLKYRNRKILAPFLAEQTMNRWEQRLREEGYTRVIPVPMHASKRRRRGYNQAELIAGYAARRLGLPLDTRTLRRVRKTAPMRYSFRAGKAAGRHSPS